MKKNIKGLLIVLCVILFGVFSVSGHQLYTIFHQYKEAERMYDGLSNQYVSVLDGSSGAAELDQTDVVLKEASPVNVDFDALMNECKDIVGWLYCADTVINYPVVQADDNDYYLHRMYDGTYNPNGTLFLDYQCYSDFSGRNNIVYGHHMNDGSMLASIVQYGKQEYYDAHPTLYLNTPTGNYRVDLFSGFVTYADSSVYTFEFGSDLEYVHFIAKMKGFSDFESPVEVGPEDRILTLSTCTYEYDDARFVLLGKLVPIA